MDAKETLNQLTQSDNGINRLVAMIGAKDFAKGETSVSFKFPRGQFCKITLNGLDLYDMEFGKIRKFTYTPVKTFNNLYAEDLKNTFEQHTKLYLKLF